MHSIVSVCIFSTVYISKMCTIFFSPLSHGPNCQSFLAVLYCIGTSMTVEYMNIRAVECRVHVLSPKPASLGKKNPRKVQTRSSEFQYTNKQMRPFFSFKISMFWTENMGSVGSRDELGVGGGWGWGGGGTLPKIQNG